MKIGIIDDHQVIIEAFKSSLRNYECVIEAYNGREMIDKFKKLDISKRPDLLIVNVNMPVMNGFETVQWLKSNYPDIKILIASSLSDDITILRMVKLGVNGYLIKSELTFELLRYAISEIFEKGTYFTSRTTELIVKSFQNSNLSDIETKIQSLTEKEIVVINLICKELTSIEIAEKLDLSARTVETFIQKTLSKLNVKSRVGIALFAERNGLLI